MSNMNKVAKELKKAMTESDERKPKAYDTEATVTHVDGNTLWVKFPGGETETPVRRTIDAKPGDVVMVRVANHRAWTGGNSTNPPTDDTRANQVGAAAQPSIDFVAALVDKDVTVRSITAATGYIDDLYSKNITTENLRAAHAYIDELEAKNITAENIDAATGYIGDLTSEHITVQDIVGDHASFNNLYAGDAAVKNLNANYAKIDAANIDSATIRNAWVDAMMVQTGLIAHEGTVYELDAIQVNASKIKTGTLDVERLIVSVPDQQDPTKIHKYMVHVDPSTGSPSYEKVDADVLEDLTITADKIVAGAITAEKITTENIVGSGGWINLRNGTFGYENAQTGNGILWDGEHLTIRADDFKLSSGQSLIDAIDGAIETWFYEGTPSLTNDPAKNWTTNKQKETHLRDVYFDTETGKSYRFIKEGSTYKWSEINDGDFSALYGKVSSNTTQIEQNKNAITLKASQADLNAATNRISVNETKIQQTANNVLIKATANDTTAAQGGQHLIQSLINVAPSGVTIDADKVNITGTTIFNKVNADASAKAAMLNSEIEVGGRNLLAESNASRTNSSTSGYAGRTIQVIPSGSLVTLSLDVDADDVVWGGTSSYYRIGAEMVLRLSNDTAQYIGAWAGREISEGANIVKAFTGSFHGRISKKFTLRGDLPVGIGCYLYIQGVSSGTVKISNPQLELGNVATDWALADEGENLLPKSSIKALYTSITETNYVYTINAGNTAGLYFPPDLFTVGESYTLSYRFKKTSGTLTGMGGHCLGFRQDGFYIDGVKKGTYSSGASMDNDTSTHTATVFLTYNGNAGDNNLYIQPNRGAYTSENNSTFQIWNIKIEKGYRATLWNPSPDDLSAEVNVKKSVHTLMSSSSVGATYRTILNWVKEGTTNSNWSINTTKTPLDRVRIGDTCRVAYIVSDMGTASNRPYVYAVGEVTSKTDTSVTMTMHGLDTTIIDGGNILTNSIGADQIAANSIGTKHLTISDSTNLATANEMYESSLPTDMSEEFLASISGGYLVKKNASQGYLMLCAYTPSGFKQSDELYYEFYGKAATAGSVSIGAWGYTGTPPTHTFSHGSSNTLSFTTTEQFFHGTLRLSDSKWNTATQYLLGFHDEKSTKSQIYVRKVVIRRKSGGELIVDGSITADKIDANAITIGKMDSSLQTKINNGDTALKRVSVSDTRNVNSNPQYYIENYPKTVVNEFKLCSTIGLTTSSTYCTLTTIVPWVDSSGGYPKQEANIDGKRYWREGSSNTTWTAWKDASATATDYITDISSAGIYISPANQSPTSSATGNSIKIDGDGLNVYKGGVSVASYGDYARVGKENAQRLEIKSDGLYLYNQSGKQYGYFGSFTRVGDYNSHNVSMGNDGVDVNSSQNNNIAHFGSTARIGTTAKTFIYIDPTGNDAGIKFRTNGNGLTGLTIADFGMNTNTGWTTAGTKNWPKETWYTLGCRKGTKGYYSLIAGFDCTATHNASFALGIDCNCYAPTAFAMGSTNTVGDSSKTSANSYSGAVGSCSAAIGYGLTTQTSNQVVVGQCNATDANARFIVGCGTSTSARKNAFVVGDSQSRFYGTVVLSNGLWLGGMLADNSSYLPMVCINSSNQLFFGYGGYSSEIGASYFDGNVVNIRSNGAVNVTGLIYPSTNIRLKNNVSLQGANTSGSYKSLIYISTNNTVNLGNSDCAIYVNGTSFKGSHAYSTSDLRLKHNISLLDKRSSELIMKLKPFEFEWTEEQKSFQHNGKYFGFGAQEVKQALSDVGYNPDNYNIVKKDPEGYYALGYEELIPHLVKMAQELKMEIEELKGAIKCS